MTFNPAPKPKPKRKGRSVRRNKSVADAARQRDGTCLYGLVYRDGCVQGFEPHHIISFGSAPTGDVLENIVCLCRKHHQDAEAHRISPITLQGVLYHFYGYGPPDHIKTVLDNMRKTANEYGLTSVFELGKWVDFKAIGFVSRFSKSYRWDEVLSKGFIQIFDADLADSQRVVTHG